LMQIGFIARTPRGRVMTLPAWGHLGLEPPRQAVNEDHPGTDHPGPLFDGDQQERS